MEGTVDIAVSCDGTWQRRGHQSLYGVETVISEETGKVLDYEMQSKFCFNCQAHSTWDRTTKKYQEWKEQQKEVCQINFVGSSESMEASGAVTLWNRSVELHNFCYTTFIGDGDSSSSKKVVESKPYREDVSITKSDCVGHVQKRMGKNLHNLQVTWKDTGCTSRAWTTR